MGRGWNILTIIAMALMLVGCPSSPSSKFPNAGQSALSLNTLNIASKQQNLWHAITNKLELNDNVSRPLIKKQFDYYLAHREYIYELTDNAAPYLYYIFQQTRKRHMPAEIALLPMIESNYTPFGISSTGATGLWQMMPGTASGFGIHINWWYDGRRDIVASTNAALNYLAYLHNRFGNWMLAIAAYNSGEGTVELALEHNRKLGKPINFWNLPLPYQTKMYIPKLMALANIISNAKQYHVVLKQVDNKPYFKSITLHHQIDLNHIAKLSKTSVRNIRLLNPGLRRWATMPNKQYALLLPSKRLYTFAANLRNDHQKLVTWMHHRVKSGESIYSLAQQFKTHTYIIKKVNNLKTNRLQPQQNLLIPLASKHFAYDAASTVKFNIAEDKIPGPHRVVHFVAKNDNLIAISKRYHVTPNQIRYWNKLAYRASLKINQPLTIWVQHHFKKPIFYSYQVKPGDSLIKIAKRFNTHVDTIQRLNHLHNDVIQLGLTLNIPRLTKHPRFIAKVRNELVTHHVKNGETLSSIAHYYSIPVEKLTAWNHLSDSDLLAEGQVLHIYLTQ